MDASRNCDATVGTAVRPHKLAKLLKDWHDIEHTADSIPLGIVVNWL